MNIDVKKLNEKIIKKNLKWLVIVSVSIIAIYLLIKWNLIRLDKDLWIWIKNTLSATSVAFVGFITNHIWNNHTNKKLKGKEKVTGEFTFIIKDNLACVALKNIGDNEVNFDFKKGVCLQWEDIEEYYYIINVMDDGMGSSIPTKAIRQFNCSARLFNGAEKKRVKSPLLKVFVYTTRGNGFYLEPTPMQLKFWEAVKELKDDQDEKKIEEKMKEYKNWDKKKIEDKMEEYKNGVKDIECISGIHTIKENKNGTKVGKNK